MVLPTLVGRVEVRFIHVFIYHLVIPRKLTGFRDLWQGREKVELIV